MKFMLMVHNKVNLKHLATSLAISLGTGMLSGLLTMGGMKTFESINKPPLSPPGWLFPIVWTILFILMGVSAYLIYEENPRVLSAGLVLYAVQLALNFIWPLLFFNAGMYLLAFVELVALWVFIILMIMEFAKVNRCAAWLQVPYLLWVTFALYLNLGIYMLNA